MSENAQNSARPAVFLATIDRESVRQLVNGDSEYLSAALEDGKNIHQVTLDRQDQVHAYMASLCDADLQAFTKLYEEEMGASTRSILDKTASINANTNAQLMQNATQASQVATWISIAMFFIVLISVISIFKR